MSDLIRRDDVIRVYEKYHPTMAVDVLDFEKELKAIPNAETTGALDDAIQEYIKDGYILAEPKVGKWIKNEHGLKCCSVCGKRPLQICYYDIYLDGYTGKDILSKYCPNCGAKM